MGYLGCVPCKLILPILTCASPKSSIFDAEPPLPPEPALAHSNCPGVLPIRDIVHRFLG